MNDLEKIKKLVTKYSEKINAPLKMLPTFDYNTGLAHPYIEMDSQGNYNYVIEERGEEYERKIFREEKELLYEIFTSITFSMASDFEVKNRIESQDSRIILFKKQEELLAILDEEWAKQVHMKNQKYLKS